LIPRASAQNWPLIEALFDLTLTSVRAQGDRAFRVVVAGNDRPRIMPDDPRVTFVEVDRPAQDPGPNNADSGRKKHAISEFVLARGGGLLMLLDADASVDIRLVEAARAMIGRNQTGALIESGMIADFQTLRAATLPHPHVFDGAFHRICGSSSIARLRPDATEPLHRDPCNVLRSHHEWVEAAQEQAPSWSGCRCPAAMSSTPPRIIRRCTARTPRGGASWRRASTAKGTRSTAPSRLDSG
jgi:hypothetical protein